MKQLIKELSLSGLTLTLDFPKTEGDSMVFRYIVLPSCKHGGSPVLVLVFRGCQLR